MADRIPDSLETADNTWSSDWSNSAEDQSTRLPVFRTWPAVYALVAATFVLWVTLLAVLARSFS